MFNNLKSNKVSRQFEFSHVFRNADERRTYSLTEREKQKNPQIIGESVSFFVMLKIQNERKKEEATICK